MYVHCTLCGYERMYVCLQVHSVRLHFGVFFMGTSVMKSLLISTVYYIGNDARMSLTAGQGRRDDHDTVVIQGHRQGFFQGWSKGYILDFPGWEGRSSCLTSVVSSSFVLWFQS